MNIYVCIKHVPDSAATITITAETEINESITFLMNPYDEHAVTAAHSLKSVLPEADVIAVTVAKPEAENTLRSALAMGADRGILVTTDHRLDSIMTAMALKAAIVQDGHPGLILTGKESIDTEGMQTMFRLANLLGLPAVTNVVDIQPQEGAVTVSCEKEAGSQERILLDLPCVLAAGKGLNIPRYPTFPDIVQARKKEITRISLEQLDLPEPEGRVELVRLEPVSEIRQPQELSGTPKDIAENIVRILKEEARIL